jgi:hypothetical protein
MYEGLRTNLSANYAKQTQSRKCHKSPQTQLPQRITQIKALRQAPKANPNKPNQSQSKPNFSPKMAPKAKANPNKPNLRTRNTTPQTTQTSHLHTQNQHQQAVKQRRRVGFVWRWRTRVERRRRRGGCRRPFCLRSGFRGRTAVRRRRFGARTRGGRKGAGA